MDLSLATCSYREFRPDMGTAVRSTVGRPRYQLPYELAGQAKLITPTWPMLKLERPAYSRAYTETLDRHGAERIAAELEGIARRTSNGRLVLLCFDDLSAPGAWCHRRMFAIWWLAQTGQDVPELGLTASRASQAMFDL